tara:strand:- start:6349 stop:7353 length:1005 start_codon:yes stop_codon:yes gene_type:complete
MKEMNEFKKKIYFPHRPGSFGGAASFQTRFESRLSENGYSVLYAEDNFENVTSTIIVVGGTIKLFWLIKSKLCGARILHRLDGVIDYSFNMKVGVLNFVKYRLTLMLISFIRRWLADHVIYQSMYVKSAWESYAGKVMKSSIIYNAIDLNEFFPIDKNYESVDFSIIVVEGTVQGDLALSALKAVTIGQIDVYGRIQSRIEDKILSDDKKNISFHGPIPRENIYKVFAGRKIYLCLEINPACPNAVIEALAAGVPIVGFNSGSLLELVGDAGIILPYVGGNPNKLEAPDCEGLNSAIKTINESYKHYSTLARSRSKRFFSSDHQLMKYKELIES